MAFTVLHCPVVCWWLGAVNARGYRPERATRAPVRCTARLGGHTLRVCVSEMPRPCTRPGQWRTTHDRNLGIHPIAHSFVPEPSLLHDPARGGVRGRRHADDALEPVLLEAKAERSQRRLGGQAAPPP